MLVIFHINAISVRQSITPGNLLGRVNGIMRFVGFGTRTFASLLDGYPGSSIGLPATLVVGALLMLGLLVPLLGPGVRHLEHGAFATP